MGSAVRPIRRENRIVPLYHQVQQVIRYRISTRQYGTGMQIPSEHELGKELLPAAALRPIGDFAGE